MQKVVTSYNLNPPLKLIFYSSILTNNNLLLKICYENIVKILLQYFSIRIFYFLYYFSSFPFIFIHRFISFFSFFFFLFFSSTQDTQPPSFYFLFHLKIIPVLHIKERERHGPPLHASPPPLVVLPTDRLGSDRFFFFLSFFLYLLVLIQLYFKNWILFCVLCLD